MKVLFLINPNAGGRGCERRIEIANRHFTGAGWNITTVVSETGDHASSLVHSAHGAGYDLLVLAGGDGTLHHAVQHLPIGSHENPSPLPFAIFPLGSGNDFYRGTGAAPDPDIAAENIINGIPVPIDIGVVEPLNDDGSLRDERHVHFINTAGVGMDSQTLATRENAPRFLSARYELLFLMTLARLYPLRVKITADDWNLDIDAYWILCCNNSFIGTGMNVAPAAKVNDGLFDVLVVRKIHKLKFIQYLPRIFKGTHLEVDGMEILRARELTLFCTPNQRVATDGDRSFNGPVRIRVLPGAVTLWTSRLDGKTLVQPVR